MTNPTTEWLTRIVEPRSIESDADREKQAAQLPTVDRGVNQDLAQPNAPTTASDDANLSWVATLTESEIGDLFDRLGSIDPSTIRDRHGVNRMLRQLVMQMSSAPPSDRPTHDSEQSPTQLSTSIETLYERWKSFDVKRHLLLVFLARHGGRSEWAAFSRLIVSDPPSEVASVVEAFVALWKTSSGCYDALFPTLLDAVQYPTTAAVVLDFCNFVAQENRLDNHPATGREPQLMALLGQIVQRLEQFEETSAKTGVADLETAKTVSESIALAVSLSHTLTLMDCRDASGKLFRMMELRHRRLRVEAAFALASFEESAGVDVLAEMAAEPLVRLRVVTYATELGLLEKIAEEHRSASALAESKLVAALAEPNYFGVPPASCSLEDHRELYWPGYDDQVSCFLFRYLYPLPDGDLENIGIVGPVTHSLSTDLTMLEPDDVYALFAGLDVQHEDIRRWELDQLAPAQQVSVSQAVQWLKQEGYDDVRPAFVGSCFGDQWVIATASHSGRRGTAIVDHTQVDWVTIGNPARPIDASIAYALVLGRTILRQFNDSQR